LAAETEDNRRYWLSDRLLKVAKELVNSNTHEIMKRHGMPSRYRRSLSRRGILELWGPQRTAIDKGLLDTENQFDFVISIPTGSGKTLIAEMAIAAALSKTESG
jgi:replicative superfamily II helicase